MQRKVLVLFTFHFWNVFCLFVSKRFAGLSAKNNDLNFVYVKDFLPIICYNINNKAIMSTIVVYNSGLKEWHKEKGYLTDTCLTAQDRFKAYLDYFRIEY